MRCVYTYVGVRKNTVYMKKRVYVFDNRCVLQSYKYVNCHRVIREKISKLDSSLALAT